MSKAYRTSIVAVSALSENISQAMVALYLDYYDGADSSRVLSDMQCKSKVLLLYHDDVLVGFTTFEVYEKEWEAQPVTVIYSGDTIVKQEHWGQQALAFAWIRHIGELKQVNPDKPIYWFLIVKGHRTFKYLPAFTHSFYPHWSIDRHDLKPLLDDLAQEKFGKYYDPSRGIIAFETTHGHLKSEYVFPKENEKSNSAVHFFLERNPGYRNGDELACICSFADENLRSLTKRILYGKEKSA